MTDKPRMKQIIGIDPITSEKFGKIYFSTSSVIARNFTEFGQLIGDEPNYTLIVDRRYRFNDVLEYIRTYEAKQEPKEQEKDITPVVIFTVFGTLLLLVFVLEYLK